MKKIQTLSLLKLVSNCCLRSVLISRTTMILKSMLILAFELIVMFASTQTNSQIIVLDGADNSPLYGAHCLIYSTQELLTSDNSGKVVFQSIDDRMDTVLISYVGYNNEIHEISVGNKDTIYMTPSFHNLQTVNIIGAQVEDLDPGEILKRALKKSVYKDCYPRSERTYDGYYSESTIQQGEIIEYNEALLVIKSSGYPSRSSVKNGFRQYWKPHSYSDFKTMGLHPQWIVPPQFYPYYANKKDGIEVLGTRISKNYSEDSVLLYVMGMAVPLLALDKVKYKNDMLDWKSGNYKYVKKEAVLVSGIPCYSVHFQPKSDAIRVQSPINKEPKFAYLTGYIYVSIDDFRIIKIDYQFNESQLRSVVKYNNNGGLVPVFSRIELNYDRIGENDHSSLCSVLTTQQFEMKGRKEKKSHRAVQRKLYFFPRGSFSIEYTIAREFENRHGISLRSFTLENNKKFWSQNENILRKYLRETENIYNDLISRYGVDLYDSFWYDAFDNCKRVKSPYSIVSASVHSSPYDKNSNLRELKSELDRYYKCRLQSNEAEVNEILEKLGDLESRMVSFDESQRNEDTRGAIIDFIDGDNSYIKVGAGIREFLSQDNIDVSTSEMSKYLVVLCAGPDSQLIMCQNYLDSNWVYDFFHNVSQVKALNPKKVLILEHDSLYRDFKVRVFDVTDGNSKVLYCSSDIDKEIQLDGIEDSTGVFLSEVGEGGNSLYFYNAENDSLIEVHNDNYFSYFHDVDKDGNYYFSGIDSSLNHNVYQSQNGIISPLFRQDELKGCYIDNFKVCKNQVIATVCSDEGIHLCSLYRNGDTNVVQRLLDVSNIALYSMSFDASNTNEIELNLSTVFSSDVDTTINLDEMESPKEPLEPEAIPYLMEIPNMSSSFFSVENEKSDINIPVATMQHSERELDYIFVDVYGAYGALQSFHSSSLYAYMLQNGGMIVLPHIRGSRFKGLGWYGEGRRMKKQNSVEDLSVVVQHLKKLYPEVDIVLYGKSAGGVSVASYLNQTEEDISCVILDYAFLDVHTVMQDSSLPLTTVEFSEWGNPSITEEAETILSYSPLQNIEQKDYPPLFVTAGYRDFQTPLWQIMNYYRRYIENDTIDSESHRIFVDEFGHIGSFPEYYRLKQYAHMLSFIKESIRQ